MGKLTGRVAIVTGASRGIGRSIALALAAEGAKVAVNYNSSEAAAREVVDTIVANGGEAMPIRANVSQVDEARRMVQEVIDRWGRVHILVNNAGITRDRTLRKLTDEDWSTVIQNNLNSVYYCTTAVMQTMID